MLLTACTTAERSGPTAGDAPRAAGTPRTTRLTVVVANEPASLYYTIAPAATRGSAGVLFDFLAPGLALADNTGTLEPLLVEAIPCAATPQPPAFVRSYATRDRGGQRRPYDGNHAMIRLFRSHQRLARSPGWIPRRARTSTRRWRRRLGGAGSQGRQPARCARSRGPRVSTRRGLRRGRLTVHRDRSVRERRGGRRFGIGRGGSLSVRGHFLRRPRRRPDASHGPARDATIERSSSERANVRSILEASCPASRSR